LLISVIILYFWQFVSVPYFFAAHPMPINPRTLVFLRYEKGWPHGQQEIIDFLLCAPSLYGIYVLYKYIKIYETSPCHKHKSFMLALIMQILFC
jgi:hypothetical protein